MQGDLQFPAGFDEFRRVVTLIGAYGDFDLSVCHLPRIVDPMTLAASRSACPSAQLTQAYDHQTVAVVAQLCGP